MKKITELSRRGSEEDPITQKDFSRAIPSKICQDPTCDCRYVDLRAPCHPDAPQFIRYDVNTGQLVPYCAECFNQGPRIAVAAGGIERLDA